MLIAAALWSKWHFPASTESEPASAEPEGAARAGASGNSNAARLLICLGQPTVPYLAPITGVVAGWNGRLAIGTWAWHMSVEVQCSWQMFADLNLN